MKIIKHLFTMLLLLCATAVSAHDFEVDGIYYNIIDTANKTVEVTHGSNEYTGSVVIPESVTYSEVTYRVTSIRDYSFSYCSGLTSVEIGNSVTSIGNSAFEDCTGLTSVEIGNSVTSIGNYAFEDCTGLTSVVIPNSVTSIGSSAFSDCTGLMSIIVSTGNAKYDSRDNCNAIIETATNTLIEGCKNTLIPNSVTSIGRSAFSHCTGLTSIEIPNSVTSIGDWAFYNCSGLTSVEIPNSVTSIGRSAFYGCYELTSIEIPNSVTSIGEDAFYKCTGLTSVEIGNSVTSVGDYAFYGCTGLMSIIVATGNANYDSRDNCNAIIETATNTLVAGCKNTLIPNSVTSIGFVAFSGCTGLTSIVIPNSVTSIGSSAFSGCTGLKTIYNLSNLTFSKGSSDNGYVAYYANNVYNLSEGFIENDFVLGKVDGANTLLYYLGNATELTLPADYKGESYIIDADVFNGNKTIKSIVIPNSVTSIGDGAFSGCHGLTSVEIGNSVTSIGVSAFDGCTGLVSIVIPNSVTSIGDYSFSGCTGLTSIIVATDNANYDSRDNCNAIIETATNTLVVGCKNTSIPNSVTSIGSEAFWGCSGLTSIEIPNSVTSIGGAAFYDCTGLTSIVIPNSVTSIGNSAFRDCRGLTSVEIPNSVTSIGDWAFYNCTGLTSIKIPNSVTSIGFFAFSGCTGLKTIYNFSKLTFSKGSSDYGDIAYYADKVYNVPNGCSIEGDYIFGKPNDVNTLLYYLGNATELTLPDDYKGENYAIGASLFKGNTTITRVEIPNSVTSIGDDAFYGCSGLKAVHISDLAAWCGIDFGSADANPLYYAKNLYLNGEKLTELVIPDGVVEIKNYTFYNCTGLTSVVIPNSVTSIGSSAFRGCTGLKTIYNLSNLTFSKGSSGYGYVAYYADKVYNALNGSIEGDYIFGKPNDVNTLVGYLGNATELTLPADYKGENYAIGASVFEGNTTMTSIEIPNSVTSIGESAFEDCTGLTSVEIPNSVTSIGNGAFDGCSGLKTVINFSNLIFSKGLSDYGNIAYYADKVYNAPNGLIEGDYIFGKPNNVNTLLYYLGNATEPTLPADYKGENYTIGASVFKDNTTMTSIEIPNSVTSIGSSVFGDCTELASIIVATGNANYDSRDNCNAIIETATNTLVAGCKNTLIPNSVTSIGSSAFSGCHGLTSVVIPNSITSIGSSAFSGCHGLTSIKIPNSVTSIGDWAFGGCTGLKTVINFSNLTFSKGSIGYGYIAYYADNVYNLPEGFIENDFVLGKVNGVNTLLTYLGNATELTLPADYKGESYIIDADVFKGNTTIASVVIPNSVTSIGNSAFSGCTGLTGIEIPNSVTSIGNYAFNGCTGLTSVVIPNSVISIGRGAFYNCTGLASVEIPNSVTSIRDYAFRGCTGLASIVIPNSVTSIGESAFEDCTALTDLRIEDGEGTLSLGYNSYNSSDIGKGLFSDCPLETLYLGRNLSYDTGSSYGYSPFYDNNTLTSVTIGNSVTSIGYSAFSGCSGLTSVEIGNSVTSIGEKAFNDCTSLTAVHISDLAAWCGIDFGSADANPLYYAKNLYLNGEQLTNLTIPAEIVEVKDYAFYNCKGVTNINIVDKIKSVGNSAFYGCSDLETLYISNTIESIGDNAFAECNNILEIKIGSKKAITANENVFSSDAYNNACLYVPTDRKDFYAKTSPWSNFIIKEMDFTGIDKVAEQRAEGKNVYYDLSGRVVENPTKGIYIINGKKVLVK